MNRRTIEMLMRQSLIIIASAMLLCCCQFAAAQEIKATDSELDALLGRTTPKAADPALDPTTGFESELAFREACRIAIDDLAHKRTEGFVDLVTGSGEMDIAKAQTQVMGQISQFGKLAEMTGKPLGFEYLGVKRAGSKCCAHLFLLRHEQIPMLCSLVGCEMGGRWRLINYNMTFSPPEITREAKERKPTDNNDSDNGDDDADAPFIETCNQIVGQMANGDHEGFEQVAKYSVKSVTNIVEFEKTFLQLQSQLGGAIGHELIRTSELGDSIRCYDFIISSQKGASRLKLTTYQADKGSDWHIINFSYNANQWAPIFDGLTLEKK